jgi:ribosome biogenesis GTPase
VEVQLQAGIAGRGQVLAAQANFMRVLIHPNQLTEEEKQTRIDQINDARQRAEEAGQKCSVLDDLDLDAPVTLLCNVRALLKKIKQRVLVGDFVRVIGIDWVDNRGKDTHTCSGLRTRHWHRLGRQ